MRRVVGALFILSGVLAEDLAHAQNADRPPPTAQFPAEPAENTTSTAPAEPAASAVAPSSGAPPLSAPPPPPPGGPPPPPASNAPPAYSYPPPYPYVYPTLVPIKPPANDSDQVFSLTLSPLLLILPIVQLTGEVRATPHVGISAILGYGSIGVDGTTSDGEPNNTRVNAYELGGRVTAYPLKKFKSLRLGTQLMYLRVDTGDTVTTSDGSGTGAGVAVGPFAGYKLVTDGGFTFVGDFGFQYLSAQAEAHDSAGNTSSASDSRLLPLLNLDLGWSF